jgi:hypothetical protein
LSDTSTTTAATTTAADEGRLIALLLPSSVFALPADPSPHTRVATKHAKIA